MYVWQETCWKITLEYYTVNVPSNISKQELFQKCTSRDSKWSDYTYFLSSLCYIPPRIKCLHFIMNSFWRWQSSWSELSNRFFQSITQRFHRGLTQNDEIFWKYFWNPTNSCTHHLWNKQKKQHICNIKKWNCVMTMPLHCLDAAINRIGKHSLGTWPVCELKV